MRMCVASSPVAAAMQCESPPFNGISTSGGIETSISIGISVSIRVRIRIRMRFCLRIRIRLAAAAATARLA